MAVVTEHWIAYLISVEPISRIALELLQPTHLIYLFLWYISLVTYVAF